ncbi:MAG: RNA methyltransferase [Ignavibacteria bacterium]|nr:RNA methyltransferase [Ignavibacteria bacterium]
MQLLKKLSFNLRNDTRTLLKHQVRQERHLFVAEGLHLNIELLNNHVIPQYVIVEAGSNSEAQALCSAWLEMGVEIFECTPRDMSVMTSTVAPQQILAVVPYLQEKEIGQHTLVLDAVSDPGNVGTIVRTAAWFGFSDVVLCRETADLYNPKTMRATAGTAFQINVVRKADTVSTLQSLKGRTIVAAVVAGGLDPSAIRNCKQLALVVGSEAHGVSPEALALCTHTVSIPGGSGVESLNAAVAAGILCYEARIPT